MSDQPEPMTVDPGAVIEELLAIPEARPYWAVAQERAARKVLQAQLAAAGRRIAELENANAPTSPTDPWPCGRCTPELVDSSCPQHGDLTKMKDVADG